MAYADFGQSRQITSQIYDKSFNLQVTIIGFTDSLVLFLRIVLVGGDGLYHEATNGLQHRMIKEAGIDQNDSRIDLQTIPIPMGIIPAG